MSNGAAFTGIDAIKFSVPLFFSLWIGDLVAHHFGPYLPAEPGSLVRHNASGHSHMFYSIIGFVGGYLLMFCLWKFFLWFLYDLDEKHKKKHG